MVKIYTKTGDKGMTTLYGGSKVRKSSKRVDAYGTVDEANSFIGLAAVQLRDENLKKLLRICQQNLFLIGAELAADERGRRKLSQKINLQDSKQLELLIDAFSEKLPELKNFRVPGESRESAYLHLARTAVRRAERRVVEIKEEVRVSAEILIYINRLSDFLFVLARVVDEVDIFLDKQIV